VAAVQGRRFADGALTHLFLLRGELMSCMLREACPIMVLQMV
jgi:hypothetical protein